MRSPRQHLSYQGGHVVVTCRLGWMITTEPAACMASQGYSQAGRKPCGGTEEISGVIGRASAGLSSHTSRIENPSPACLLKPRLCLPVASACKTHRVEGLYRSPEGYLWPQGLGLSTRPAGLWHRHRMVPAKLALGDVEPGRSS